MMDIARRSKVVFLKYKKWTFIKYAENRRWISLIEAIGILGRQLPLFIISKSEK